MGSVAADDDPRSRESNELWAHSRSPVSLRRHTLEEHLRGTAALARQFGEAFGAAELAEYLALVHDVGKAACAWQAGLVDRAERTGGRVGVPHKEAGAFLAARYTGKQFAAVVQGHHGGLPAPQVLKTLLLSLRDGRHEDQLLIDEACARAGRLIPEIHPDRPVPVPAWLGPCPPHDRPRQELARDLLIRMLFSCLVDADFLDTAAHFAGLPVRLAPSVAMSGLTERFETRRRHLLAGHPSSEVNDVRQRVYEQVIANAAREPGIYVLHVPTGGGKTLASAGFALHHAAHHGLRRVVVAVPYISITEQNAKVYRDLLDPTDPEDAPVVLEHHSAINLDDDENIWARTAAENWDAPFVVTTTVQLFQSLFANKPAAMRKLHRLAGSVIVLDEVQALPDRLLVPILSALRGLVEYFGVTVVLASATQPDFWSLTQLDGVPRRQLAEEPATLFRDLRRVRYEWRMEADVTWEGIADEISRESGRRTLVVVNSTKDAAMMHRLLRDRTEGHVLHLSTRMTAGHRRETIERMRTLLDAGAEVRVVSTSLIEAGVDIDFPLVYRAWAPAESLQQAAGRCNRDGRLAIGTTVVFRVPGAGAPRDETFTRALDVTATEFGPGRAFPDDLDALDTYYKRRYALQGGGAKGMGTDIDALRALLDFPAVTEAFKMIDDTFTQPVIVIRPDDEPDAIEADIAALRSPYPAGPGPLRRLQPYVAALPRREAQAALAAGLAQPVIGDMLHWQGAYHPERGLDPAEPEDRGAYSM
ncbi:CRISPR-associated helicase Cas3' [Streptomyces avicenniae]|uniref:CRISPR-associated helicase Cas3' n=1 Tax=Streptomyces avicenniae TaxID=500153 RepID=UPI000DA62ECA|nr:CRISPR-associated helicase Cas3' [Streptomyces avicenniae]